MATDIKVGFRTYLLTQATVTTLVGSRIYFGNLPQNPEYPCVFLTRIGAQRWNHLGGECGVVQGIIQTDVLADDAIEANAVAEAIRQVVHGYSGAMGSETVQSAMLETDFEGFDPPVDGGEGFRARVAQQYQITYEEEAAAV